MTTLTVLLKSINDVKNFVRIVNDYNYDVDLISGRYVVDGKSIMGIFSLDLASPIEVHIHAAEAADLVGALQPFVTES
ncbi:MAG: HPr family phosphocarrier protein [Bacillota bacterium]|nr:HPr family phosphocarrier protein [Bacillota bacterium]